MKRDIPQAAAPPANASPPRVPEAIFDRIRSNFYRLKDAVPVLIRADYVRAIYLNMLETLDHASVLEFWRSLPLTLDGRTYREGEIFRHIWKEDSLVPMVYDYCVGDYLEPFLLNLGVDPRQFLNGIFIHNNQSTYVSGKTVLSHLEPVVFGIFRYADLREGLLDLAHIHTENFLPGHRHRIAKVENLPGGLKRIYMAYVTDATYRNVIQYDNDFLTGIALGNLPRMLKLQPFAEGDIANVCDSRPLDYIIWEDIAVEWKDGQLLLGGRRMGRRTSMAQFTRKLDLDLSPFRVPEAEVVEMLNDYVCPYRNRVVLRKGCAYGAPLYLQAIQYPFEGHNLTRHLESITRDITETPLQRLRNKHEALVALTEAAEFTYSAKIQRCDLNGAVLVKGISAQILAEILVVYVSSGGKRRVFEFAYFKKLKGFNVGFEVHLGRIQKALLAKSPNLRIVSVAKGTFELQATAPIQLRYSD